jgi:hypothetical protein
MTAMNLEPKKNDSHACGDPVCPDKLGVPIGRAVWKNGRLVPIAPASHCREAVPVHESAPVHRSVNIACQMDWVQVESCQPSEFAKAWPQICDQMEQFSNDLSRQKPSQPTEPLEDCPGSCTEPDQAHRENVVCCGDESRRFIE